MDFRLAASRVSGLTVRTAREERRAAVSRAFVIAEAAYRVAGLDEEEAGSGEGTASEVQTGYIQHKGDKWCVRSEKNKDWSGGCYDTKGEAEDRLKQVEMFKHMGADSSAGITFKSAPEYKSIEDFVQYMMDDERDEYDHEDLKALNYRLRKPLHEIKSELESYGLKLKKREPEKKGRGFQSPDHDRWFGPGSDPTHGGGGAGSKWVPSAT